MSPHLITDGLFAELDSLRTYLRRAYCLHGKRLSGPCFPDCMEEARALLSKGAGEKGIEMIKELIRGGY